MYINKDALCQKNGLLDYSWKKKECIQLQEVDDMHDACDEVERMLIHIDEQSQIVCKTIFCITLEGTLFEGC